MLKIGIRTRTARTEVEVTPPPSEAADERPTLTVHEPEDLVMAGVGEPYRPRHAADITEGSLDLNEASADLPAGRHRG